LEVVDQNRGGLLVAYENIRGFIPNSHIPSIRKGTTTQKAGEIKSEMIGKILPLKVIEIDAKEHRLVFSARAAQSEQHGKRIQEIELGEVIKSRVVNVVDFGVFVDLEGVDGLVHKSEIDWERIPHPSALFQVGDEIEVKVVDVDKEKGRVSLSRKALLPNPWLKNVEGYQVGDLVEGVVVNVLDFGAFVELDDKLDGLVHVSEIGYANPEDPQAVVKKGDPVLVKVLSIDPERERISLSMRRVPLSEQMEWIMNLEDAAEGVILDGEEEDEEPEEVIETDLEEVMGEVEVDADLSEKDGAAAEEPLSEQSPDEEKSDSSAEDQPGLDDNNQDP
jgi:small subunit ribosomal protein S1